LRLQNDSIVFLWDNSVTGDNNPDVTLTSQVDFETQGFFTEPDFVDIDGIFSYTHTFTAGGPLSTTASGLTFTATVTGGDFSITGPVTSLATYDVDFNAAAVPIPPALWLFGSGILGLVGLAGRRRLS